jgi:hypothetical protein
VISRYSSKRTSFEGVLYFLLRRRRYCWELFPPAFLLLLRFRFYRRREFEIRVGLVHHGPKGANCPPGHVDPVITISSPVAVFRLLGMHTNLEIAVVPEERTPSMVSSAFLF